MNPRRRLMILVVSVMALALAGCGKVKDITVTSLQLESIAPQGLKGIDVYMAVGIDNPAFQIGLEDIHGSLKHSGKILGRVTMDPMVLQRKSAEIYHVKAFLSLGEDARLRDLLMFTNIEKLYECTVDVSATPRLKSGLGAPITLKDIPLKKLLEDDENEKK